MGEKRNYGMGLSPLYRNVHSFITLLNGWLPFIQAMTCLL